MFYVVKKGEQIQAELVSTAYRGSAVYIRYLTTQGNVGVSIPYNSAQAAKAYMFVDWVPNSGVEYSDSATGADRITSTPSQVVCHYGGIYKTNKVRFTDALLYAYRTGLATSNVTAYGKKNYPYPRLWVTSTGHATYPGYLSDTSDVNYNAGRQGTIAQMNANFWLRGFDCASSDSGADSVQQTLWAEVENIPNRIGVGLLSTSASLLTNWTSV